jgi:cell division protein FtsL
VTEFFTVKRIDNSRVVRAAAPRRLRECARLAARGGVLAIVVLLYAWQHFQCIQMDYRLQELKSTHAQAAELNAQLRLEVAGLRSPMRIDAIARHQLGLTAPVPGQVAPSQGNSGIVVAQVRRNISPVQ